MHASTRHPCETVTATTGQEYYTPVPGSSAGKGLYYTHLLDAVYKYMKRDHDEH
jgi:hypothetical protein